MSIVSFAILFCHSEGCFFILFIVSFAVQKLLSLIKPHLFTFVFISITLGGGQRWSWCDVCQSVLPTFSSKSFMVSGLTFKSLIHFEVIFVYGAGKCSSFILLHVSVQFSQHYLLNRLPFLHRISLPPLSKIKLFAPFIWRLIPQAPFLYSSSSIPTLYESWFLKVHSSFSRFLWLFGVFCVSIHIMTFFVLFLWKNAIGSLIGIALNLWITLDSTVIFTILILPIQEHGPALHLFVSFWLISSYVSYSFCSVGSLCR